MQENMPKKKEPIYSTFKCWKCNEKHIFERAKKAEKFTRYQKAYSNTLWYWTTGDCPKLPEGKVVVVSFTVGEQLDPSKDGWRNGFRRTIQK